MKIPILRSLSRRLGRLLGLHPDVGDLIRGSFRLTNPTKAAFPSENLPLASRVIATGMWNYCFFQFYQHFSGPFWVERQYNPKDPSFIPRAGSLLSVNLTHRTWMGFRAPSGHHFSMVDPAGALCPVIGYYSIEIALMEKGKLLLSTRGDLRISQHLMNGTPVPVTVFESDRTLLAFTAASAEGMHQTVLGTVEYRTGDGSDESSEGPVTELMIAVRPFNPEGAALIHSLKYETRNQGGGILRINEIPEILLFEPPDSVRLSSLMDGDAYFSTTERSESICPYGIATGSFVYRIHGSGRISFAARSYERDPDQKNEVDLILDLSTKPHSYFEEMRREREGFRYGSEDDKSDRLFHLSLVTHKWKNRNNKYLKDLRKQKKHLETLLRGSGSVEEQFPPASLEYGPGTGAVLAQIEHTSRLWSDRLDGGARFLCAREDWNRAAHIFSGHLLSLQTEKTITPGVFTYRQFWYRDSAYMLWSLAKWNFITEAERVLYTYSGLQESDGFFKSHDGEWDSNGQAIWSLVTHATMTGNRDLLTKSYRSIRKGAIWIEKKRRSGLGQKLMPPGFSAEHLGPSDHYTWDNLWSIAGLQKASLAARILGEEADGIRFQEEAVRYAQDLLELTAENRKAHGVITAGPARPVDPGMIGSIAALYPLELDLFPEEEVEQTIRTIYENYFLEELFFHPIIHSGYNIYLSLQTAQCLFQMGDVRTARRIFKKALSVRTELWTYPEAIHPLSGGGVMGDGFHGWAFAEMLSLMREFVVHQRGDSLELFRGLGKKELFHSELLFGPFPLAGGKIRIAGTLSRDEGLLKISLPGCDPGSVRRLLLHIPAGNKGKRCRLDVRGGRGSFDETERVFLIEDPGEFVHLEYFF